MLPPYGKWALPVGRGLPVLQGEVPLLEAPLFVGGVATAAVETALGQPLLPGLVIQVIPAWPLHR